MLNAPLSRTLLSVGLGLVNTLAAPALHNTAPAIARTVATPPITEQLEPISSLVAHAESSTVGDYNAANAGSPMDLGKDGLINLFGRDASQITIGEIMDAQAAGRLHAAGRYQIIGKTMPTTVSQAGLDRADYFNANNQDLLFIALIKHKRPRIWSFLNGTGSVQKAADDMAKEWASMPWTNGRSYYGGQDRAHASRAQVLSALQQARKNIRTRTVNWEVAGTLHG